MKNKQLVSIIIINWNGLEHLKLCLNSLRDLKYDPLELIIVDNASKDKSILFCQSFFKRNSKHFVSCMLIKNKRNSGFAEGNNIGFAKAKGEYILLLNNDTVVEPNFLSTLVKAIEPSAIGAVQPRILQYPNKKIIDSVGSYLINSGFLYHFGHNKIDRNKYHKPSQIFSMKGACMLLKKEVLDTIGLFDNDYFAYFEETDLCQRIWLSGYEIWYEPIAVIYHKGGQTAQKLPSTFVQFHAYKNRIYTYLKNFEAGTLARVLSIHLMLCLIVIIAYIAKRQFRLAWAIVRAIGWNVAGLSQLLAKRKTIAKIRRVHDRDYLPKITRPVRFSYYYHLLTTSLKGYKD